MRSEIVQSKGYISKTVTFDEVHTPHWMHDIRTTVIDGQVAELEPAALPIMALGRSLAQHLKMCGILDGYNSEQVTLGTVNYVCKLELRMSCCSETYVVRLELSYRYRDPQVTAVNNLNSPDITECLFKRLIGKAATPRVEMRMRHLLVLKRVVCDINGLTVTL